MKKNLIDHPKEECGIAAVWNHPDAARVVYQALLCLQHRGEEAAGIATINEGVFLLHKAKGRVKEVFAEHLNNLPGRHAIAHNRYSTADRSAKNAQPFVINNRFAFAHNGHLRNTDSFPIHPLFTEANSDSAKMASYLASMPQKEWIARLQHAQTVWNGAFAIILLTQNALYAMRDPYGFRPLHLGKLPHAGWMLASETLALENASCQEIQTVPAGAIIKIDAQGMQLIPTSSPCRLAYCTFEQIYFSHPDSLWEGARIGAKRNALGQILWDEAPAQADVVIAIPDSAIKAAQGFAARANLPLMNENSPVKNLHRSFLSPEDQQRQQICAQKFQLADNIQNKRVILIDDSIVRGHTIKNAIQKLRLAGAKEIHVRIACPPLTHPCFMGVDIASKNELFAANRSIDEMRQTLNCDSLVFLSLQGMMSVLGKADDYCNACYTGKYPISIT